MNPARYCAECGAEIGSDTPGGQCARCLMKLALAAEEALDPTDLPSSYEEAGTSIGRYKLLEKLGEGGFGTVWAAEQREPVRRRVALKVIKLGMDTRQVVARFEAERQALALMDHPNIARVLDAGATDSGRPYFVMELVRGVPITNYCRRQQLPIRERLELFIKVCHAVQHAHQKGIIHRDIKPSNILVTLHDGVPVPKVIDFGIAKATQGELTDKTVYTQIQQFLGTPAYMSPEQATGDTVEETVRQMREAIAFHLEGLAAAGPAPAALTVEALRRAGFDAMPSEGPWTVTVPGSVAGKRYFQYTAIDVASRSETTVVCDVYEAPGLGWTGLRFSGIDDSLLVVGTTRSAQSMQPGQAHGEGAEDQSLRADTTRRPGSATAGGLPRRPTARKDCGRRSKAEPGPRRSRGRVDAGHGRPVPRLGRGHASEALVALEDCDLHAGACQQGAAGKSRKCTSSNRHPCGHHLLVDAGSALVTGQAGPL
jgi:hypothetical protein